eukprot:COSAG06_NODE_22759_length_713_cov_20.438111_1_plen_54_part_10
MLFAFSSVVIMIAGAEMLAFRNLHSAHRRRTSTTSTTDRDLDGQLLYVGQLGRD